MYWKAILLTVLIENYSKYEEFAKALRRYYYLNWIAGFTLTKIKQTSFNHIKWIKEKKPLTETENELNKNLIQNSTVNRPVDNLNGEIHFDKWSKPLLFMTEYNQSDDSNLNFLPVWDRNIHSEHIIPRAYIDKEEWSKFRQDDEIDDWINTGANLTLLSGAKNTSASNEGFDKKLIAYNGKGNYSKEKKGVTSFQNTEKIVSNYYSKKHNREWN